MRSILPGIGTLTLISGFVIGMSTTSSDATPVRALADPVLVVSPGHLHGWHIVTNHAVGGPYSGSSVNPSSTASYEFREGPGHPPLGEGSLELSTGGEPSSRVAAVPPLGGVPLDSLTRVTYDTYLIRVGIHGTHPIAFKIAVTSHELSRFTTLVFEPDRQPGHAPVLGEWQAWDAVREGHWWATGVTGECSQAQLCTWSELESRIGASSPVLFSYFELGASGDSQADSECALDAVVIGDAETTYDLEAEQHPSTGEETPEIPPEEGEVLPGQVLPGQVPPETGKEVPVTG